MATYLLADADVAAVFFKTGRTDATTKYRMAPYLLVTYDDGTSGMMPIPRPSTGGPATAAYVVADIEVDRIEIYDGPPYAGVSDIGPF